MDPQIENRSARKHRAIVEAATTAFLKKGYLGTNMDEIAALAAVSKRTVYHHFVDKDRLFSEIVLATTDRIDGLVLLVADSLSDTADVTRTLRRLDHPLLAARHFVGQLLWIPMNQAMFTGDYQLETEANLQRHADAAVLAFLTGYGPRSDRAASQVAVRP